MSSWKEYKLGELLEITSSKRIMRSEYIERGIPFYRSKEIIELHNNNDVSTEIFISDDTFNKIKDKFGVPKEGDLLLTSVGTLGIPYLVKDTDCFYFKDGNLTWFRNFDSKICSEYLYYWLLSPIGKQKIKDITIGSTQQALTIVSLKSLTINLPDLEIQKYIVDILNSISEKIKNNIKINQTLEQIAQTIFKSWFIDFDPIHAKANALASGQTVEQATQAAMAVISGKNTQELHRLQTANPEQYQQLWEIAEAFPSGFDEEGVPWGWEERYLKDVCNIVYGKNLPTSELKEQGYPVFGGNGVIGFYDKYLYEKPHTLVSCRGAASGKVIYSLPNSFVTNNSLVIEHSKSYLSSFYVYEALSIQNLTELTSGSAQPQMTIANMNPVQIIVPAEKVHSLYFNFVKDMYDKKLYALCENESLSKIRDELLPKLLSGEVVV